MLDRVDAAGRPLGEQQSPRLVEVETHVRTCPFADSRRGGPMNATAMAQVEAHWPAVLGALRQATGPTAGQAWRATCRLRWAVLSLPDPVPVPYAAMFKTALGLTRPLSSWLLLSPGAARRPLEELVPAADLLRRLDEEGWLHGAHQVCAGPPRRIVEAWRALTEPEPGGPAESALAAGAVDRADRAMDLVVGLWAILGATRLAIRAGRGDGDHEVRRLLGLRGPGALVREVPRFEPEWALHVYDSPPPAVVRAVADSRAALDGSGPLPALDRVWGQLVEASTLA